MNPAVAGAALAGVALLAGCNSPSPDGRWERHADVDLWSHAALQQVSDPVRLIPQATLLFAAPTLVFFDRELEDRSVAHPRFTDGDVGGGNVATGALGTVAAGMAMQQWLVGDSGRSAEVLAESWAVAMTATGALKLAVRRARPGHGADTSFPSGHAAFAFSTATWIARTTWDATDSGWRAIGWLSYLPAAYIGVSRIEGNQHFPSDVAVGAFLGAAVANLIYDAHVGDHSTGRDGIFPPRSRPNDGPSCDIAPLLETDRVGLAWFLRF